MRKRRIAPIALVVVCLAVGALALRTATAQGPKSRPTPEPSFPAAAQANIHPHAPLAADPRSRTNWPAQATIAARYGRVRNCLRVGNTWVITTLGTVGQTGIVALYPCTANDQGCLNRLSDHLIQGWAFLQPQFVGGLTLLGEGATGECITVDDEGRQLSFSLFVFARKDVGKERKACCAIASFASGR